MLDSETPNPAKCFITVILSIWLAVDRLFARFNVALRAAGEGARLSMRG